MSSFHVPKLSLALVGLMLLAPRIALAKTTWNGSLANPMPSQSNLLWLVYALDSENAWAVGKRNTGGNDEIVGLRTTNGLSWQQMSLPQGSSFFPVIPTALIFVDANTGYLAATEIEGLADVPKIFATTNGGGSWTERARLSGSVVAFQKLPSGEIFGVGGGYFVRSTDGQTWSSVAVDPPSSGVGPAALSMLNGTCGFLAGGKPAEGTQSADGGAIWYTEDGGQTWEVRAQGLPYYLGGVSFVASDLGWAVGQQGGNTGVFAVTYDGGRTFTRVNVPDHPALPSVCMMSQCLTDPSPITDMVGVRFWDANRGVAHGLACTGGCDGDNPTYLTAILRTYDRGSTWEYDEHYHDAMPDISLGFLDVPGQMVGMLDGSFPNPNHYFFVGQYEMILRYKADWIEDPAQSPPSCTSTAGDGGVDPGEDGGVDPRPDAGPGGDAALTGCGCQGAGEHGPAGPLGVLLLLGALLCLRLRRERFL